MLYSYEQATEIMGSKFLLAQAVKNDKIYKIEKGIYSYKRYVSELEVISMKYSKAVFTMNSAFYYYGLTKVKPTHYHIKTESKAKKLKDLRVKQTYESTHELYLGITSLCYDGVCIKIYNKERLFVELVRSQSKLPPDYYQEILMNYKKIIDELDIYVLKQYANVLPKSQRVLKVLETLS